MGLVTSISILLTLQELGIIWVEHKMLKVEISHQELPSQIVSRGFPLLL